MGGSGWQEVAREHPYSICNKPNWCSISLDGKTAICRRKDNGTGRLKVDQAGANYWVYELHGSQLESKPANEVFEESGVTEKADPETLNEVYEVLLDELSLSSAHYQNLLRRGLSDTEIKHRRYRTLPPSGREEIAHKLVKRFEPKLCSTVPGLYANDDSGRWSLAGASGILVPVRDAKGRIVALKVRADDAAENRAKYTYLSSKQHSGPGPGAQVHIPLHEDQDRSVIRLTEGELKADIATTLTKELTVSIPGVSSWQSALPVLRALGCGRVHLAFDADANKNETVAQALSNALQALDEQDFEVALEIWPPEDGKGIDDLLATGHKPTLVVGDKARKAVKKFLVEAKGSSRVLKNTLTAEKLLNTEFPEIKWIVSDVLPEGTTILGGKPKIGKSWLALDIGLAVASGGAALGEKAVEQGAVLYLALEDNQRRLKTRLKKLLKESTVPQSLEFAAQWPRLNEGGLDDLETWLISRPDAHLVIIDTLVKIRKTGNSNERKTLYNMDYESVEPLLSLAARYNVAVLIVHHLRKAGAEDPLDEISGSTGLTGGVDGVLVLKRERGQADAYLHVTGRDIEDEQKLALNWDNNSATWKIAGDAEEFRGSKERQEIINCLRSLKRPAGPKEVSDNLGRSPNNVKQLLFKMSNDGEVRNIGGGKYTVTDNFDNHDNRPDPSSEDEGRTKHSISNEGSPSQDVPIQKVNEVIEVIDVGEITDEGVIPPLLTNLDELEMLATEIQKSQVVAVDLETTGLSSRSDRVRLLSIATAKGTWLVDCFEVDPCPLFPILAQKKLVFHNGEFDLGFLFTMGFELGEDGEVIDTMLMSQILKDINHKEEKEAA